MNLFSRKPVAGPEVTGTQALRDHLKRRTSGPNGTSFAKIASEINDALNDIASRNTARDIAKRMAPDADEAAIRSLIASLNLTSVAGTAITGQQLENFVAGRDLDPAVKDQLTRFLHAGHAVFNAETDRLESAYRHQPHAMTGAPPQYVNPNPAIAKAQAACKAVMAAARGPIPLRKPVR
ncbi:MULTISPECIES: hypothetical protein [unclassified Bradyrhizobium]|uniref:hypothetical protein n=1 Tax=unclassified Bradyrhizobium TaxID=2631580 RepID=UPI0033991984